MAERTKEHYEKSFKTMRKYFSALANRIRNGDIDSHNAKSIQAIRKTVLKDCQIANTDYTKYLKIDATSNNEDYATLGVLGPTILNGLQAMIEAKSKDKLNPNDDKTIEYMFGGDQ